MGDWKKGGNIERRESEVLIFRVCCLVQGRGREREIEGFY